jgi:acetolactate synthase regulatory subunit
VFLFSNLFSTRKKERPNGPINLGTIVKLLTASRLICNLRGLSVRSISRPEDLKHELELLIANPRALTLLLQNLEALDDASVELMNSRLLNCRLVDSIQDEVNR